MAFLPLCTRWHTNYYKYGEFHLGSKTGNETQDIVFLRIPQIYWKGNTIKISYVQHYRPKHATQLPLKQLKEKKKRSGQSKRHSLYPARASNKRWGREENALLQFIRRSQQAPEMLKTQPISSPNDWLIRKLQEAAGGRTEKQALVCFQYPPFSTVTPQIYYLAGLAMDPRTVLYTIYHKVILLNAVSHPL